TTVAEARLEFHKLRQRAGEPFTEFLVRFDNRFESQLAKADRLGNADGDKIEMLQMALHADFDVRATPVINVSPSESLAVAAVVNDPGIRRDNGP
ncbi:hypothetical protein E4U45_000483, partial [Claviceps purpurea]